MLALARVCVWGLDVLRAQAYRQQVQYCKTLLCALQDGESEPRSNQSGHCIAASAESKKAGLVISYVQMYMGQLHINVHCCFPVRSSPCFAATQTLSLGHI